MGLIHLSNARQRRVGLFCVAAGLLLWLFVHPAAQWANNATHFVSGMLIGASLVINLHALWLTRRNRQNHA